MERVQSVCLTLLLLLVRGQLADETTRTLRRQTDANLRGFPRRVRHTVRGILDSVVKHTQGLYC